MDRKRAILTAIEEHRRRAQAAWDRYEVTGSRKSDETHFYNIQAQEALEKGLAAIEHREAQVASRGKMEEKLTGEIWQAVHDVAITSVDRGTMDSIMKAIADTVKRVMRV